MLKIIYYFDLCLQPKFDCEVKIAIYVRLLGMLACGNEI